MSKSAITPTRHENYPEWYQQVIRAADLAEVSPVRGCMVIKPWGFALWENMKADLDTRFKDTGHENAYFPLFIPLSFLQKEADHVEGFAKECAVVTHHRLEAGEDGTLQPAGPLEEPLVVRPTSETIIGEMFSKWVQSYRDLPVLINQWANVVRWEMRTRLFLRTSEFLWQEGHTAHATDKEAIDETLQMLDIYGDFCREMLAMPVIKGEKTVSERFPGAVNTYTIEALMQDKKALQAGTSHFLGQNFAKAQEITFQAKDETTQYAWTTSWGVSTRLIGGLVMTHSDDDGLVLPPRVAPQHVVIIPIFKNVEEEKVVMTYIDTLVASVKEQQYAGEAIRIMVDKKDDRSSNKVWKYIKRGVPIRLEIGPRDVVDQSVFMGRRDKSPKDKMTVQRDEFVQGVSGILEEIQQTLLDNAISFQDEQTKVIDSVEDFTAYFADDTPGYAYCYATEDDTQYSDIMKKLKVSARCIPIENNDETGACIFTGKKDCRKILFAKAY